jgi:hypothetical protein
MQNFHDKHKLKKLMTPKPEMQKMLKGIPDTEEENEHDHENMEKKQNVQKELISK